MKYISGIFALNIPCSLDTTGDWHRSSLPWDKVDIKESDNSPLKAWGIEKNVYVRELNGRYNVANTLRACVDFLDTDKYLSVEGMRKDYLGNDKYNQELFKAVYSLKPYKTPNQWENISKIIGEEYNLLWIRYLQEQDEEIQSFVIREKSCSTTTINSDDIDNTAREKVFAFANNKSLVNLKALLYVVNKYYEKLNPNTRLLVEEFFQYNSLEKLDYILFQYNVY